MTQSLSRYHARAPRYILQPQDNTLIRVSGPQQTPWEEATSIQDISLSGLAFTAPAELCPIVGEIIKVQFEIPGSEQMACHGLVVRLQALKGAEMLVGVQFKKLELPQRMALAQALASKLKEQMRRQTAKSNSWRGLFGRHRGLILFTGFFVIVWCAWYYVLSTILSST